MTATAVLGGYGGSGGGGGGGFSSTNGSGEYVDGYTTSHTFNPLKTTPMGGVGPYTYAWTLSIGDNPYGATWSMAGAATDTVTPSVSGLGPQTYSIANLYCTVTDTGTGAVAYSNVANYFYANLTSR